MEESRDRKGWGGPITAIVVAVLSFLPLGSWVAAHPDSEFALELTEWISGSVIAIGGGFILALLARDWKWLWPHVDMEAFDRWITKHWTSVVTAIAGCAFVLYTLAALFIFKTRPAIIDEMVQVIQARIFAGGHLWLPTPRHPEFFSSLHMVTDRGHLYSQFPPGGPGFLAIGVLLGVPWMTGPIFATAAVFAFAIFVRIAEPHRTTAALALLLFAIAPFTVFMSGSFMNHVTTAFCLMVAIAGLAVTTEGKSTSRWVTTWMAPFLSGLGLGTAATIRPVDALAFALPAAVWYLVRTFRDFKRWPELVASGIGVAIPMAVMLYINQQTTGSPLLFGYEVLWGRGHDLGFHRSPMGTMHTPALGLAYINDYFIALQRYLFETPIPGLLPAIVALWLTRRLRALDRYLIASSALVVGLYFAYWHAGFFVGPRFFYALVPVATLWTARFPALWQQVMMRDHPNPTRTRLLAYRAVVYALVISVVTAACYGVPMRARLHTALLSSDQTEAPHSAQDLAVRHALIFVRESWESQLVTRLWALGVSHVDAERFYHDVDACRLDHAISAEEARADAHQLTTPATADLLPLVNDSNQVALTRLGVNGTIRVQHDYPYTPDCVARIRETESGVLPLTPYAMTQGDSNVYARDLHVRDTVLLKEYPTRAVYLLRPASSDSTARPHFYPVNLDSARKDWMTATSPTALSR